MDKAWFLLRIKTPDKVCRLALLSVHEREGGIKRTVDAMTYAVCGTNDGSGRKQAACQPTNSQYDAGSSIWQGRWLPVRFKDDKRVQEG